LGFIDCSAQPDWVDAEGHNHAVCPQEKEDELWKAMDEELKGIIAFYMRKEAEVLSKLEVSSGYHVMVLCPHTVACTS
jgi:hypothetical protein